MSDDPYKSFDHHIKAQEAEIARLRAALATARREGMEQAAKRLQELHKNHGYDAKTGEVRRRGELVTCPLTIDHTMGYYRAIAEGVAHIRAAAEITRLCAACDASEERERAIELRFCQTVDRDGLTGLPSDMWAALEQLTQDRAALATARREGMETALRLVRHYEAVAYQHGDLPYMDPHECAAQAAREIASSIEAIIYSLVKDEPWRRACDQCGVSLPANCPADEGYGCPACETHKERDEDAIRAAAKEGKP